MWRQSSVPLEESTTDDMQRRVEEVNFCTSANGKRSFDVLDPVLAKEEPIVENDIDGPAQ
jgi:hypothetical protein